MTNCKTGFMRTSCVFHCIALLLITASIAPAHGSSQTESQTVSWPASGNSKSISSLPLAFETNRGQAAPDIDFIARGHGYGVLLRANRVTLTLGRIGQKGDQMAAPDLVEMNLTGVSPTAKAMGENKLPGHSNYLLGSSPAGWITDVEQYGSVRYKNVYPGIDVLYRGEQGRFEHDFVLHPGARPTQIRVSLSGASRIDLDKKGNLRLETPSGEMVFRKPHAYQTIAGKQVDIQADYSLQGDRISFRTGSYDRKSTLTIDPVVVYSTFFGGPQTNPGFVQYAYAVAVDGQGNLYVAGVTDSSSFPTTSGALQPKYAFEQPYFLSKFNPAGTALIYSTYLSGIGITAIQVDSAENVFIAGGGGSDLPIPTGSNPFQSTPGPIAVLKLNSQGNGVIYATYSNGDAPHGLAIDNAGDAYVSGAGFATGNPENNLPLVNPLQSTVGLCFLSEVNPTGTGFVYSTYLGGPQIATSPACSVAVDSSANAYVVSVAGTGFPTTENAYQPACPPDTKFPSGSCPVIMKISAGGTSLAYSTYFGNDVLPPVAAAVDGSGNLYLTGNVFSNSFPLLNPIQSTVSSIPAVFVAGFNSAQVLKFSTFLGDNSLVDAIALDSSDNVYITGSLGGGGDTGDIPLKNPIYIATSCASICGFASELTSTGASLVFSTYLPGTTGAASTPYPSVSGPQAVAVDDSRNIYLAGSVSAQPDQSGFPVFNAFQPNAPAPSAAFLMKISPSAGAAAALTPSQLQYALQQVDTTSTGLGIVLYNLGSSPLTISSVTTSGDFEVQTNNCPATVPAATSCGIVTTFTPTAVGTRNGSLIISDSSPGSPHTVALVGVGGETTVSITPTSLNFGDQAVGVASPQRIVSMQATGGLNVQVTQVTITGDFSQAYQNCDPTIAPPHPGAGPCQILVKFTPTAMGTRNGTLTITDTAISSPQVVPLTGTGVPPGLGLGIAAGSSGSATVTPGATAKYSLSIGGEGMSGTASLTCSGAPTGATCSVPATIPVSASTATTFSVTVSTVGSTAARLVPSHSGTAPWIWAVAIIGCLVLPGSSSLVKRFPCFLLAILMMLCSCGGGGGGANGGSGGTTTGMYNLSVTAQMGSTTQSAKLSLMVQ